MKTLYLECAMGAAGDMLMASLYDLMDDAKKAEFLATMNGMGLEGVKLEVERTASHGISGSHMHVYVHGEEEGEMLEHEEHEHHHHEHHDHDHDHDHEHHHHHDHDHDHDHEHHHHHDHDHDHHHDHDHEHGHHHHHHATPGHIAEVIGTLNVPEPVKAQARKVYDAIARAEAKVHGTTVQDVHYHEVGALDAVADVTGVCLAISLINPDRIVASPIHVGSGTTVCAHGVMPVPAPATAELLRGVPSYGGEVSGELCTPTGAALVAHFANEFGPMPVMAVEATGYGIGTKDFGRANFLRCFLGEAEGSGNGELCELVCNIDDMSPEALQHACAQLLTRGALDAYVMPGTMKKGRAGHQLTVLCDPSVVEDVARAVLEETTTNGLRVRTTQKWSLVPRIEHVTTDWGEVRVKVAEGFGVRHAKPEHDDVSRLAAEAGVPISRVFEQAIARFEANA